MTARIPMESAAKDFRMLGSSSFQSPFMLARLLPRAQKSPGVPGKRALPDSS
jgi:hypothetical protein